MIVAASTRATLRLGPGIWMEIITVVERCCRQQTKFLNTATALAGQSGCGAETETAARQAEPLSSPAPAPAAYSARPWPPRTPPFSGRHTPYKAAPSCPSSAGCRAAGSPPRPPKPPVPGRLGMRLANRMRPMAGTPAARSTIPAAPRPRTCRPFTAIPAAPAALGPGPIGQN